MSFREFLAGRLGRDKGRARMPSEIRSCPKCHAPVDIEVPKHIETWGQASIRAGSCEACGAGLIFVPGHNGPLGDLGISDVSD
jgi:hypothetical protein